ncbi:MAG: hypothetical protein ACI8RZ_005127 [Myxococcota bacterium]|jgi:hypothetical protein
MLEAVPGLAQLSGLRVLDLSGVQLDAVPRLPCRLRELTLPLSALSQELPRLYAHLYRLSWVTVSSGVRTISVEVVGSEPDERLATLLTLLHKTEHQSCRPLLADSLCERMSARSGGVGVKSPSQTKAHHEVPASMGTPLGRSADRCNIYWRESVAKVYLVGVEIIRHAG